MLSFDKVSKHEEHIDNVLSMLTESNINYASLDEINFGQVDLSSTSFIAFGEWIKKEFSAEKERQIGFFSYLCYK